jgi:universal stress protein A
MSFKKILVSVDFSPSSRQAMDLATQLAVESKAELVLVHVWQPPMYSFGPEAPFPGAVLNELIGDAEKLLDAWTAEAKQRGVRATAMFLTGVAWDQIVDTLRNDATYDLAVIGTHGRTGLKHMVLGSVAEKVVRHAPCAVMVARQRL